MPNVHHKSKKKLTIWTEEELKLKAQSILQKKGLTLTDEITNLLIKIIEDEKKQRKFKNS